MAVICYPDGTSFRSVEESAQLVANMSSATVSVWYIDTIGHYEQGYGVVWDIDWLIRPTPLEIRFLRAPLVPRMESEQMREDL